MDLLTSEIITTINGQITLTERGKELLGKTAYHIDCSTTSGQLKAYQKCDVVRSVLSNS